MTDPLNASNALDDERYQQEYTRLLQQYGRLVADDPAMIDQVRASLKLSAQLLITNRPEAKTAFGKLADELDAFLAACQAGDIDPKQFAATGTKPASERGGNDEHDD